MKTLTINVLISILLFLNLQAQVKKEYVMQDDFRTAIVYKDINKIKALLQQGAVINEPDYLKIYPLMEAVRRSSPEVVQLLIDNKANIHIVNNYNQTPLAVCLENTPHHEAIAQILIKAGAKIDPIDNFGRTPLFDAASENKTGLCKILIENGADVNFKNTKGGGTALNWISNKDFPETVKLLLDKGADVTNKDNEGNTALFNAAINSRLKTIELLMKKGADPLEKCGKTTPLNNSILLKKWDVVKVILNNMKDINVFTEANYGLLHDAVINERIELVKILIELKANLNIKNKWGQTPLTTAYSIGNQSIISLLEQNGATK